MSFHEHIVGIAGVTICVDIGEKIYKPINEKTSKLFKKGTEKNRKTFIHAPCLKKYVENNHIVVIGEKPFKTSAGNGGGKSESLINIKNLQTRLRLIGRKIDRPCSISKLWGCAEKKFIKNR